MGIRSFPNTYIEGPFVTVNDLSYTVVTNNDRGSPNFRFTSAIGEHKDLCFGFDNRLSIGRDRL